MNQEQTLECISLIYQTAMDSRKWKPLLHSLENCLGGATLAWVEYDPVSNAGSIVHASGHDPEYIRSYHNHYAELDPWMQFDALQQEGAVLLGEQMIDDGSLLKTSFYHHWLEPQDLFYQICVVVKQQDGHSFCLQALRSRSAGSFAGDEQTFFQTIAPHLTQAISLNRYLWQMIMLKDVLQYQPYTILVVDHDGAVLFANTPAANVLTEENGIFIRDNILTASNNHLNRKLKSLIDEASQSSTPPNLETLSNTPLVVSRGKTKQPLSVMVLPLHRKLRLALGQTNKVAIVFISTPELGSELPCSVLATLYGLTPAESRLLRLILNGLRLCDASDELGITQNTARTHMKHIYAKTGAERQVDLVRLGLNWNSLVTQQ